MRLDNPHFLDMLKDQVPVRFPGSKHTKLSQLSAKKCLNTENYTITTESKKFIERKLVESKGIPFGQFKHDGVKSLKGNKLQSFGFQFMK